MKSRKVTSTISPQQKVEVQLKKRKSVNLSTLSEADILKLAHEIEVHQVELETQNDELRRAKDIAEKAEKQLQNSETRYRRLFEAAKDGILILDTDNGKIVDANPFIIEMLGYSLDELIGKELWDIGLFKNISDSKDAFTELKNKGYTRFEDLPLETKKGKPINVEFVSNVYLVDQTKVIQCNIRDITQRKQAEIKLKESEVRLRELNATKDKFFSIIAHDLKNPFMAILGFSDLLVEKISDKDYKSIEEYVNIIRNSSQQVLSLLTNLLQWASSQTGKIKFNPEMIEIGALIKEVTELSSGAARQKSITVSKKSPSNFMVFADKSMISTTLRNIISNAIKFTNPGGKIVISAMKRQDDLLITISDNGNGMKKETLQRLFEIEDGYSSRGTQNEPGTGLGLILCKEFVTRHKGKIWAESQPGKGSKFHFTIPTI